MQCSCFEAMELLSPLRFQAVSSFAAGGHFPDSQPLLLRPVAPGCPSARSPQLTPPINGSRRRHRRLQASLLSGQKLQGVLTSDEVQAILRQRGWEQVGRRRAFRAARAHGRARAYSRVQLHAPWGVRAIVKGGLTGGGR